ncbi:MAG: hypothetical protein GF329_05365, partial [Candidatus Lokiarchaeota archaeon]|nr:hypothetical protein [Candidatus Lokiarchaeota archaeon]
MRARRAFYFNSTNNDTLSLLSNTDYYVDADGKVSFPEGSLVYELYNNYSEVKDALIYFEYDSSEMNELLKLKNAEGFFINFTMPSLYYDHTTISKLTVKVNDYTGNSFAKVFFDVDLKKYFMPGVKSQYEDEILGFGKVMNIPLYIPFNELKMSNTNALFDLSFIESIEITVKDSERWPGSFMEDFEGKGYSVLDLPYQKVGIRDISLYNYIADSVETDEQG